MTAAAHAPASNGPIVQALTDLGVVASYFTAVQLAAAGPERSIWLAWGELSPGRPVRDDTLFSVHCATKPIVAVGAVLALADAGRSTHTPVRDCVAASSPFAGLSCTVDDVLRHRAGLASPTLLEVNLTPESRRAELLAHGLEVGAPGYSEYAGQVLLAEIIATQTGRPASRFLEERVLAPLRIHHECMFEIGSEWLSASEERIGYYTYNLPDDPVPLLHDRSPHLACQDRVTLGGYVSARALCGFYAGVLRSATHGTPFLDAPALAELLAVSGPPMFDPVLQRDVQFVAGFCRDLRLLSCSGAGASSFGQPGFLGASIGFADPCSGVAGAFIVNGLHHARDVADLVRERLVEAILLEGSSEG